MFKIQISSLMADVLFSYILTFYSGKWPSCETLWYSWYNISYLGITVVISFLNSYTLLKKP